MRFYDISILVVESDRSKINKLKEVLDNLQFKGHADYTMSRETMRTQINLGDYDFIIADEKPDIDLNKSTFIKIPNDDESYAFFESKLVEIFSEFKKK